MATVYRFTVKTEDHRTRDMMPPTHKVTVARATAKAKAAAEHEIYANAVRMLASNAPATNAATAWIEVYDGRSAPRTLAKFSPLLPNRAGIKAQWLLNEWSAEYDANEFVDRIECK
jgi:hypothetical protein